MAGVLPAPRLGFATHDGGVVIDDDVLRVGIPAHVEISVIVGRAEQAIDPGVAADPDVGAGCDQVLADEVAPDGQEAGRRIDLPIENGAVDPKILFGPDSREAVPEQGVEVDIAVDLRILGIMANVAVVPLIVVE